MSLSKSCLSFEFLVLLELGQAVDFLFIVLALLVLLQLGDEAFDIVAALLERFLSLTMVFLGENLNC